MKFTSTRMDALLLRAKVSLGDLFAIRGLKKEGIRLPAKIYVHTMVRRLIFMCTSLRFYFIERIALKSEVAVLLSFEEIVALCCERELFTKEDEPLMRSLGSIHTKVTFSDGPYQSLNHEMLNGVPKVLECLDRYISQQRAIRFRDHALKAMDSENER